MFYVVLFFLLLILSYQDLKELHAYDVIFHTGILFALSWRYFSHEEYLIYVLESIFIFLALYLFHFFYQKIRKADVFGLGDVYTSTMITSFLGLEATYFILIFACILVGLYAFISLLFYKKTVLLVPFIPFLTFGTLTFLLWNKP